MAKNQKKPSYSKQKKTSVWSLNAKMGLATQETIAQKAIGNFK